MASTRKSLAGSAAAAAKKVIGRRSGAKSSSDDSAATPPPAATKKAPAKKAPSKRTTTAKASVKAAAPAKKSPAKKAGATKAGATKAASTRTTTKSTTTKSTPAKTAATKKAAVKKTATKASAKKVPMSSLVVREGEASWIKTELDEVLAELHEQRDKLVHVLDEAEQDLAGLMRDAGDGAGHDQADMGATSFERDHEITVLNNEREMLAQIDRALGRIHDGSYGICESCGQPIGKMRLMAFPRATLCMTCKQREERR